MGQKYELHQEKLKSPDFTPFLAKASESSDFPSFLVFRAKSPTINIDNQLLEKRVSSAFWKQI